MFRTRKKAAATPPPERKTAIGDPFAVIPVQPDGVELKRDSRGMIHLRLTAKPAGLTGKVVDWLRYDYSRKLELDENGSLYYSYVDGQTTLDTITDRLAAKLDISRKEAETAVILYTKKLMTMDFLALIIPEDLLARSHYEKS